MPTSMCLQLAKQSVRYLAGIAKNISVKIRNFFVPVDFVVLDMEEDMSRLSASVVVSQDPMDCRVTSSSISGFLQVRPC